MKTFIIEDLDNKILFTTKAASLAKAVEKAVYQKINLERADLRGAYLIDICLRGAKLAGASLEDATLEEVDFRDSNLEGASFISANICKVNFTRCNIKSCSFFYAVLEQVTLINVLADRLTKFFSDKSTK